MYITGTHAIEEALENAPKGSVLFVLSSSKTNDDLIRKAKSTGGIVVKKVMREALDEMSTDHRGAVLSIVSSAFTASLSNKVSLREFLENIKGDDETPYTVLLLDGITDPHNLGAILRSSDQFGVNLVVLPPSRTANINETVMRISSGAYAYVNIAEGENMNQAIARLKENGFWTYAADMNGEKLSDVKFAKRTAIIMGREGEGLHPLVRKNADFAVNIPTVGHIDSLNVSVATGIMLYASFINRG